jgi:hypothetical protein
VQYYFNVQDGATLLDDEGLEFTDINEVRTEDLQSAVDFIKDIRVGIFGRANHGGFGSPINWRVAAIRCLR